MKIQSKTGSKEVFDLDSKIARVLIAAGSHVAYVPPQPVRVPCTAWSTGILPPIGCMNTPAQPAIIAKCATCGSFAQMTGPNAHKTQALRHCGVVESVPADIAEQYAAMLKEFKSAPREAKPVIPAFVSTY